MQSETLPTGIGGPAGPKCTSNILFIVYKHAASFLFINSVTALSQTDA